MFYEDRTDFENYIMWVGKQSFSYGGMDCFQFARLWVQQYNFEASEKMERKMGDYYNEGTAMRCLVKNKIKSPESYMLWLIKCGLSDYTDPQPEGICVMDKGILGLVDYDRKAFFLGKKGLVKVHIDLDEMRFVK